MVKVICKCKKSRYVGAIHIVYEKTEILLGRVGFNLKIPTEAYCGDGWVGVTFFFFCSDLEIKA